MITKNAKAMQNMFLMGTSDTKYGVEAKNKNGTTVYIVRNGVYGMIRTTFATSNTNEGISVGSGTTPPTEDDYKLESMITSGLSSSGTIDVIGDSGNDADGNIQTMIAMRLRNTSSSPITITEIGMTSIAYARTNNDGTGSSSTHHFLFDRTLLDAPITINPSEIGTIQYTIKMVDSE